MDEFAVAYHERDHVKVLAFDDRGRAIRAYEGVSDDWAKVLIHKNDGNCTLLSHGIAGFVQQCIDVVCDVHSFFPGGSWLRTAKDKEGWYDTWENVFRGCALCLVHGEEWIIAARVGRVKTRSAKWRKCDYSFLQGEKFENRDGKLRVE